ncbi:MAG: HU family DNA-binding protein [Chloroflexota bacterium]
MTVKYNIIERGKPGDPAAPKKFYPSVVSSGRITVRELANMAARESTLSTMDLMAAYESLLALIPDQLAKGNVVELGDFGSFWLRNSSDGSETAAEANDTNITIVKPRFNPGRLFKDVLKTIRFEKA